MPGQNQATSDPSVSTLIFQAVSWPASPMARRAHAVAHRFSSSVDAASQPLTFQRTTATSILPQPDTTTMDMSPTTTSSSCSPLLHILPLPWLLHCLQE